MNVELTAGWQAKICDLIEYLAVRCVEGAGDGEVSARVVALLTEGPRLFDERELEIVIRRVPK
jgi:hypothetical protein